MKKSRFSLGFRWAVMLALCGLAAGTAAPLDFSSGLSYTNYVVPRGPWSIHVARVSRADHEFEIHSIHARGAALGLSTLTEQIKSFNPALGTPVAGVNGDFYVRDNIFAGDPRGLQVVEGEVISGPVGGVSFWMDASGQPRASNVVSRFKVTWADGATTPFGLNEERYAGDNMVLFTPALGGSTHTRDGVELVLERQGEGPWLPLVLGTTCTARIREVRQTGNGSLSPDILILSVGPKLARTLPKLEAGSILKISTETLPDLREVKTAISGGPLLLHQGRRQDWEKAASKDPFSYAVRSMSERHPRTAIGWDEKNFYLLEVDGRQKISVGMTLDELADFMIKIGCKEAMNFDGGGSAMIWYKGRIVNSPCDRRERDVANALLVVRKPRVPGEADAPHPLPGSKSAP